MKIEQMECSEMSACKIQTPGNYPEENIQQVSWPPASKQSNNMYDIYLMLCVQSWTPDDGRKDRPKHVEWYSINSKIVHLVGFTIEIYHNSRSHERQIYRTCVSIKIWNFSTRGQVFTKRVSYSLFFQSLWTRSHSREKRPLASPYPSFCPPVCPHILARFPLDGFSYGGVLRKSAEKIQI
jgi:hypothetical protein